MQRKFLSTGSILFTPIFLLLFIFLSCSGGSHGGGGQNGDPNFGSALINATEGGSVSLADEVKLTIPEGSLKADTQIRIERKSRVSGGSDGLISFGQAYEFTPEGTGFDLNIPALLEISYDSTALTARGLSPETLHIYYFDETQNEYVAVSSRVDTTRKKITAYVEHFTVYLPMAKAMIAGNNSPFTALQSSVPNPIRADAPIYVRATARDYDGAIASVRLYYRKLHPAPGAWQSAIMKR